MNYLANVSLLLAASALLGGGAFLISRKQKKKARFGTAGTAAVLALTFHLFLSDSVFVARVVPLDDVLVFGQWLVPLAAIFLGLVVPAIPSPWWRKALPIPLVTAAVVFTSFEPLFTAPPEIRDRRSRPDGKILQTTSFTCGAGATAQLLEENGIPAKESEMAALCMTRSRGTHFHGMIRGLRAKAEGAGLRVEAMRGTFEGLRAGNPPAPALVMVHLTPEIDVRDPRYARDWGWRVGFTHVVVLLGFEGDEARVADPAFGLERWNEEAVRDLMTGQMIRLVKR